MGFQIPDARALLEGVRDRGCLKIGKQLKTHPVVQMAERKAKRKVNTLMSAVRPLDRDNPREESLRVPTNRKRKTHRAIWEEETVYDINIAAKETPAEPRCGVKMEVGQHQILRMVTRTGPTSTKRDSVPLAIHLAMGQYTGNKRNLFIVSTDTTET